MSLIIVIVVVIGFAWWVKSQRTMSLNERLYLKRRGYAVEEPIDLGPPVPKDTRLINLIESLETCRPSPASEPQKIYRACARQGNATRACCHRSS